MKLSTSIITSIWLLIILNFLMACAGIMAFQKIHFTASEFYEISRNVAVCSATQVKPADIDASVQNPDISQQRTSDLDLIENNADRLQFDCKTGEWIMVIMSFIFFLSGLGMLRSVKRLLLQPLGKIMSVLNAVSKGDIAQRCPKIAPHRDITALYSRINENLDK